MIAPVLDPEAQPAEWCRDTELVDRLSGLSPLAGPARSLRFDPSTTPGWGLALSQIALQITFFRPRGPYCAVKARCRSLPTVTPAFRAVAWLRSPGHLTLREDVYSLPDLYIRYRLPWQYPVPLVYTSRLTSMSTSSEPRMGRPPLNMKSTNLRLPQETMDRIDAIVGKNQRARFIREAIEHALKLAESLARRLPPIE